MLLLLLVRGPWRRYEVFLGIAAGGLLVFVPVALAGWTAADIQNASLTATSRLALHAAPPLLILLFGLAARATAASDDTRHPPEEPEACKKLIIQIPCYNEEDTIGVALDALPRDVPGVDVVEWLVVDDGSTDRTVEVARAHGADHIISHAQNRGLARAFMTGLEVAVRQGADIIVNTDADNQYDAADIPALVAPILEGRAEIVVGARPIAHIRHFSPTKKFLQRLGSWLVRLASNTNIPDAPSGFRAFARSAAMRINVFDDYTYTIETVIQAGRKGMAITAVPVHTNEALRPSRLMSSIPDYIRRSILTIVRIFMTYRPFHFFAVPGLCSIAAGLLPAIRFLYFYLTQDGAVGHVQSLLLSVLLLGTGFALVVIGLVADLIGVNRILLEDIRWRLRCMELERVQDAGKRRTPGKTGAKKQR